MKEEEDVKQEPDDIAEEDGRSSPAAGESPRSDQSMQARMEEYLSQMSEQYSAYQTLAAQAAITQQLQAASSTTQALATQAALAQYVQQMQLNAAASQAQQTAGGYAQAQAMMQLLQNAQGVAARPARGRGSRGGGSPRGRKGLGLKLKRLDSGEYVPRGGGRGSRGGRGSPPHSVDRGGSAGADAG